MKATSVTILLICILLATGCVSQTPREVTPQTPVLPASVDPLTQGKPLPMDGHAVHTTPNTTFEVWIDSFEIGEVGENGEQELTIYVAAKNTGTGPLRMTWYSKLTDLNGKTYGGIGISHGGSGARSKWITPEMTEAARDYVIVRSDRDLAALKKGGVLDVYFFEKPDDAAPIGNVPSYHTAWTIDAGAIR
jgi:hypothetical protein